MFFWDLSLAFQHVLEKRGVLLLGERLVPQSSPALDEHDGQRVERLYQRRGCTGCTHNLNRPWLAVERDGIFWDHIIGEPPQAHDVPISIAVLLIGFCLELRHISWVKL